MKLHSTNPITKMMAKSLQKKKKNIHFQMEQFIKDNGKIPNDMDTESKYGRMERSTRDTGKAIRQMVKESSIMWKAIFTKATGCKIRQILAKFITQIGTWIWCIYSCKWSKIRRLLEG